MTPHQVEDLHELGLIAYQESAAMTWLLNFFYARHLWLLDFLIKLQMKRTGRWSQDAY